MADEGIYVVSRTYRDLAKPGEPEDQFLRWINRPGSGMPNSPGIRPVRFRTKTPPTTLPAFLVLVTLDVAGPSHNPWEDLVDPVRGTIRYWGDAKFDPTRSLHDFRGNAVLAQIYDELLTGDRTLVPPVLHFVKPTTGWVRFSGLCALDRLELTWFEDEGRAVRNYRAHLSILDVEGVPVSWLHERADSDTSEGLNVSAPDAWKSWTQGVTRRLELWRRSIRTVSDQVPDEGSADARVLDQLVSLSPQRFEALTVRLMEEIPDITHKVEQTRLVRDGGFDMEGEFVLPTVGYEIRFKGEAKRYARKTAVGPKDVSRLVARLGRGEYGIFLTTSYFTRDAQREVIEDGYPVKLLAGADLVGLMRELRIVVKDRIRDSWLELVTELPERPRS